MQSKELENEIQQIILQAWEGAKLAARWDTAPVTQGEVIRFYTDQVLLAIERSDAI